MTNTVALNPSESKALNLNQFKQAVFKFETEESMVDFSVFRRGQQTVQQMRLVDLLVPIFICQLFAVLNCFH